MCWSSVGDILQTRMRQIIRLVAANARIAAYNAYTVG